MGCDSTAANRGTRARPGEAQLRKVTGNWRHESLVRNYEVSLTAAGRHLREREILEAHGYLPLSSGHGDRGLAVEYVRLETLPRKATFDNAGSRRAPSKHSRRLDAGRARPFERQLEKVTAAWHLPRLVRQYPATTQGAQRASGERAILELHTYLAVSSTAEDKSVRVDFQRLRDLAEPAFSSAGTSAFAPVKAASKSARRPLGKIVVAVPDNETNAVMAAHFTKAEFIRTFTAVWKEPEVVLAAAENTWAYRIHAGWVIPRGIEPAAGFDPNRVPGDARVTLVRSEDTYGTNRWTTYRVLNKVRYVRELGGNHEDRSEEYEALTEGNHSSYWSGWWVALAGRVEWIDRDDERLDRMAKLLRQSEAFYAALRFLRGIGAELVYDAESVRSLAPSVVYDADTGTLSDGTDVVALERHTSADLRARDFTLTDPGAHEWHIVGWEVAGTLHRLLAPALAVPGNGRYPVSAFRLRANGIADMVGEQPVVVEEQRAPNVQRPAPDYAALAASRRVADELAMLRAEQRAAARNASAERGVIGLVLGAIGLHEFGKH